MRLVRPIHHAIEDFVREQIRLKLQIADGQVDSTKLKAMVKHWSQQMSAAVSREAGRNVTRKASQMVDTASIAQRSASATIDSGDDFSHQSTQAKDNYDNFDQTIMGLEASQTQDPLTFSLLAISLQIKLQASSSPAPSPQTTA